MRFLTRLPAPHRLAPADAWALLSANFVEPAKLVALAGRAHAVLLARLAAAGTGGGRTYDALIGGQAATAGADVLLTLNPPPRTVEAGGGEAQELSGGTATPPRGFEHGALGLLHDGVRSRRDSSSQACSRRRHAGTTATGIFRVFLEDTSTITTASASTR